MAAMLGVASGRVVRSFEIQVAKATNGQKNDSVEESIFLVYDDILLACGFYIFFSLFKLVFFFELR